MLTDYLLMFLRVLVGFIFVVAVIEKMRSMTAFAAAITQFIQVERKTARFIAVAVLLFEMLVILLLTLPSSVTAGFILAVLLLILFSLVLFESIRARKQIDCNCFGKNGERVSRYDLWRNGIIGLCAGVGGVVDVLHNSLGGEGQIVLLLLSAGPAIIFGLMLIQGKQIIWALQQN